MQGSEPPPAAGGLDTADVTISTVANIGPGIDFYFAFGVIAVTAGVAAPLTILAAAVAVVLLAFTVAEFTRSEPSAGNFITYVETGLGARAGVVVAVLVGVGYTVAIAGVFTMSGGMVSLAVAHYFSWNLPWEPVTLVLTLGAVWLTLHGVRLSTRAVGLAVLIQVTVMLIVCTIVLIDRCAQLSAVPFSWSHLSGGLGGLSAGFPLALYMFIGWENGPALAEDARDPARTIPRALVAGANSQARMLFDGGRSGLLPAWLGRVHPPGDTPRNALVAMAGAGLSIIAIWWAVHLLGFDHGSTDPVGLYAECSTMGTIVILFVYLMTSVALPVFMWRRHRERFSAVRHVALPALGALTLVVPFIELCRPGQPAPYSVFPYLALGIVVIAAVAAVITVRRHPTAGESEGTPHSVSPTIRATQPPGAR